MEKGTFSAHWNTYSIVFFYEPIEFANAAPAREGCGEMIMTILHVRPTVSATGKDGKRLFIQSESQDSGAVDDFV